MSISWKKLRRRNFLEYPVKWWKLGAPERTGYNFKGWHLDKAGSKGKQWDFARTVEKNTSSGRVTLYAKWADEIAPVLEKASYEKGDN